jgi:hypothetical protein
VEYFAASGIPVSAKRWAALLRDLAVRPAGETQAGPRGGRGKALYYTREMQELHRDLAEWLIRIPDGASPDPRGG